MIIPKKRNSNDQVLYYTAETADIVIENKVFRLKDLSLITGSNAFGGLVFNNCANIKIRNCTFIAYTKSDVAQMRALSFTGGNSGLIDVQFCTFIGCAFAAMFTAGTYNSFIFKHNIALEPNNVGPTSMENDARFVFFNTAVFTTPAEIDKNRWQSIEGMAADIINTFASENIKMRFNRFLGFIDSTKTNTLSNGGGVFVLADNGGLDQDCEDNVIVNAAPFGSQVVGELTGGNINYSRNKVLIELKNSALGKSQMAIQMQNCQTGFVFEGNKARGYLFSGAEQSIYHGTFYDTCGLYDPDVLIAQNTDNDPHLTKERLLPNRIV